MQMIGMAVYSFLVVTFYTFLGLFLGNRIAEIAVTAIFTFVVMLMSKTSLKSVLSLPINQEN
jgi:hypothetical protein